MARPLPVKAGITGLINTIGGFKSSIWQSFILHSVLPRTFQAIRNWHVFTAGYPFDTAVAMRENAKVEAREAFDRLDAYWRAAADFLTSRVAGGDRLIAPPGIADCFPANDCHSGVNEISGTYQWVVVHKGLLREAEESGALVLCLALEPVFANEVFVVFSGINRFDKLAPTDAHYQSFLNVIAHQFAPARFAGNRARLSGGSHAADRQTIYMGNHCALTTTVHGQAIYVDTRDLSLAPRLLLEGKWEEETTDIFCSYLKRDATVIDIGANVGYYTLLAASKVGARGKVIAFEANRDLYELLFQSVFVNGFRERCELVNKAVTDKAGNVAFQKVKKHMGGSSVAPLDPITLQQLHTSTETEEVESLSLDSFFQEHGIHHVDLIKIDAEGSEPLIFRGMQNTLDRAENLTVIFEFNPASIRSMGEDPLEMLQSLINQGFSLRRISPSGLAPLGTLEEALSWPIGNVLMEKKSCNSRSCTTRTGGPRPMHR